MSAVGIVLKRLRKTYAWSWGSRGKKKNTNSTPTLCRELVEFFSKRSAAIDRRDRYDVRARTRRVRNWTGLLRTVEKLPLRDRKRINKSSGVAKDIYVKICPIQRGTVCVLKRRNVNNNIARWNACTVVYGQLVDDDVSVFFRTPYTCSGEKPVRNTERLAFRLLSRSPTPYRFPFSFAITSMIVLAGSDSHAMPRRFSMTRSSGDRTADGNPYATRFSGIRDAVFDSQRVPPIARRSNKRFRNRFLRCRAVDRTATQPKRRGGTVRGRVGAAGDR